jgi:hypothetical protein
MRMKGRAPAAGRAAPVGYGAEQGQHKQRQHIVQRHNKAGPGLRHAELVGKYQGYGRVVSLPECADEEKGKAHAYGALVIQFHFPASENFVDNWSLPCVRRQNNKNFRRR